MEEYIFNISGEEIQERLDAVPNKADKDSVYTKTETDAKLANKADKTDVYTKTQTDTKLANKADKDSVYTKTETDTGLAGKADKTDVYTKTETDTKFSQLEQEQIQGGIYDVSAHNNSAVFESLQALLNSPNLSTLIPISVRHGGMSIRFINSDNKYVQWTLISDEFTMDITKWRGVDKKPVSGSKNLIESNAVYELEKTTAGLIDAESDADVLVADENGKVLAAFVKGGFKTKKFDSSKISIQVNYVDAGYGDFNLADEQLNSILRLYDGHIRTKKFDSKSICDIINNNITYLSTVISKYDNKVAHCGTLEFDDFGNWYSAYYKDDETTHETPTNLTTKAMIAYGNLADQSKVTRIEVIGANQTIGDYTQGARAPYDPNFKIFNGIGRFYFNGYVNNKVVIAYRNFDISTKEVDNNIYIAKLKYTVSGTEKTVDFTTTNLYTMLSELGISATFYNDLVLSSRFVQYESYWYVSLSGAFSQNLKPVILRTQDGVTFEYVTYCSGFNGGSVESSLEIIDGNIIVSQRNTANCQIGKYGFNGNVVVSPKVISTNTSKTALIYFNGKLICAYNVYPNIVTEWGTVSRSRLRLAEIDTTTLAIKNYTDITNDAGIHYPFLNKYKGSLYMVFTEDRKKLNIDETRSNISLTKLIN